MHELSITTHRLNHLIDPALHIWGWEVGLYLFLGGLSAGILILSALVHLLGLSGRCRYAAGPLLLWAPVLLSLGMLALFLDLEYKLHVFRFYTSFQVTSPMSWGAWILLLFYPLNGLMILGAVPESAWPAAARGAVLGLREFSQRHLQRIAGWALLVGVGLGLYTGVLLAANSARPLWNNILLSPIFLVSGASTAAALVLLFSRDPGERRLFAWADATLISVEILLLLLYVFSMQTSTETRQQAVWLICGGPYTAHFWVFLVGIGLLLPLVLGVLELRGRHLPRALSPVLVLFGGLFFRFLIVKVGQVASWPHV